MKPPTKTIRIHRQVAETLSIVATAFGQSVPVLASKILAAELERLLPEALAKAKEKFSDSIDAHRRVSRVMDAKTGRNHSA